MMEKFAQKILEWSFYLLFFLVPLFFHASSHELFEYNKMMLTYGLTAVIVSAWLVRMVQEKRLIYKRTLLEIPLLLYLASHILSTLFSLDPHVSFWGYYSRFHEGLFSTISYLLLYFAAVSNLNRSHVLRVIFASVASAAVVSLYGISEHFGVSPSCGIITGKWNVSCWVQDVQNRVFATLGQPNWMAAYLDVLILTSLGFVHQVKSKKLKVKGFVLLPILFLAALIFTKSRSGFLGLAAGVAVFFFFQVRGKLRLLYSFVVIISLIAGTFYMLNRGNSQHFSGEISESGDIRKVVWSGAISVWQRYPILGSGVETFAYAYYKDRPAAHNLLSEWDFLYNKAHNEYLNLLATTGTVGFLSYLGLLGTFAIWFVRSALNRHDDLNLLPVALFSAWISILVTNFFGFSVVIVGLYFFLVPAFCLILSWPDEPKDPATQSLATSSSWFFTGLISLICLLFLFNLWIMWQADKSFAYGKNLDSVSHYVDAYPYLLDAVDRNEDEPTFRDELAYNQAILATAIFQAASGSATEKMNTILPRYQLSTNDFVNRAIADSNKVVEASPNSMPFWKTRTRMFYQLATLDNKYYLDALSSIQQAANLAPTDAKVHFNLGILLERTGQKEEAVKAFEETIALKPDYREAYYTLALYYFEFGQKTKARKAMEQILLKVGPDKEVQQWLEQHQ